MLSNNDGCAVNTFNEAKALWRSSHFGHINRIGDVKKKLSHCPKQLANYMCHEASTGSNPAYRGAHKATM